MSSFAAEDAPFPFVHAVIPIAFYISSRSILWTLLAVYVFETLEAAVAPLFPVLTESVQDSLIGDPLIAFLAVLPFWVLDKCTNLDAVFEKHASVWARVLVFVFVGIPTIAVGQADTDTFYVGIIYYCAIYLFVAIIGYYELTFYIGNNVEMLYAKQSVAIWLLAVVVYATVSAPVTTGMMGISSWMRVLYVSVANNILALTVYIVSVYSYQKRNSGGVLYKQ